VWLASSTEEREVGQILAAHRLVCDVLPDAALILAPRQPAAADKAAELCRHAFGLAPRRSRNDLPESAPVYVADSMGEMGLWYRLAPVSLICHSLPVEGAPPLSGKNPFEAVALGSVVLHGPDVGNFSESYDALEQAGACRQVVTPQDIADRVIAFLSDARLRSSTSAAAFAVLASGQGALDLTVETLVRGFPPAATATRLVSPQAQV
jgi:3-deoxy-D-manno-octulosonic-acid transferase